MQRGVMVFGVLKAVALGGVIVAGGGIVAGIYAFSNSKDTSVSSVFSEDKREGAPDKQVVPESKKESTCIIYEARQPQGNRFSELVGKFGTKEEFFQELEIRVSRNKSEITQDVNDACAGTNLKKNVAGNVYIWYETDSKGQSAWVYSNDMHSGGIDWVNDGSVRKSFN